MGHEFKIGDRVICSANYDGAHIQGQTGTVIALPRFSSVWVSIQFDDAVRNSSGEICGHTGNNGNGQQGYCWDVNVDLLMHDEQLPDIAVGDMKLLFDT